MLRKMCPPPMTHGADLVALLCMQSEAHLYFEITLIAIKKSNKVGTQQQPFFHEKSSSTSSPGKVKKKKQCAPCLGDFVSVGMQIVQQRVRAQNRGRQEASHKG